MNTLILLGIISLLAAVVLFISGIVYKKTQGRKIIEKLNSDYDI